MSDSTTTAAPPTTLLDRIAKAPDLEAHIRIRRAAGHDFLEIRDYVPSTETYGRGFMFEADLLGRVIDSLVAVDARIQAGEIHAGEIPGQLALFDATEYEEGDEEVAD